MRSPWRDALTGMIVLAAGLGIGRFAFTPLLPLMQADAGLSVLDSGWLASVNNVGYLAGAVLCTAVALPQRSSLRTGLVLLALVTACMGLTMAFPLWLALRFLAGVAAALLMVHGIAWCTGRLRARQNTRLEPVLFSGPGIGIAITGALVAAVHAPELDSARWWLVFGAVGIAAAALAWRGLRVPGVVAKASAADPVAGLGGKALPLLCIYGLFGFSYIIPAIFLPLIVRTQLHMQTLGEWLWPIYGLSAALAVLGMSALPSPRSNYAALAGCAVTLLSGILLIVLHPQPGGLIVGTVLLGAMMLPGVMFTMREANRIAGRNPARLIAALTTSFSIGQITGPLVAAALATRFHGFTIPLALAAGVAVLAMIASAATGFRQNAPARRTSNYGPVNKA